MAFQHARGEVNLMCATRPSALPRSARRSAAICGAAQHPNWEGAASALQVGLMSGSMITAEEGEAAADGEEEEVAGAATVSVVSTTGLGTSCERRAP